MQVYAQNTQGEQVFVERASRQHDYFCLECGGKVRVRGGPIKQLHFFHTGPRSSCRQHAKSQEHLAVQLILEQTIGSACRQEAFCKEIGRVADLLWEDKKIVFEVQCSPISSEEIEARIHDYRSIGYEVVWILHDRTFNQWRISAAEFFLQRHTHYFTNMGSDGGTIYDQYQLLHHGRKVLSGREQGLFRRPISIQTIWRREEASEPFSAMRAIAEESWFPLGLIERVHHWGAFFAGDYLSLLAEALEEAPIKESRLLAPLILCQRHAPKPLPRLHRMGAQLGHFFRALWRELLASQ